MPKETYRHTGAKEAAISHHHTYYVTSSYILCHIIIHTMSHHHTYYTGARRRQPAASAPRARMQRGMCCAAWRLFAPKRDAHASSTRIRRGKARREGGATHMHACTHARTRARTHTHILSMSPSYSHREIHTYIYITYILGYILTYSYLYYTYSTCLVNTVWRPIARTWRPALGFSVSSFGAGGWCFLPGDGASSCGVSAPERGVVMGVSRSPV